MKKEEIELRFQNKKKLITGSSGVISLDPALRTSHFIYIFLFTDLDMGTLFMGNKSHS